MISYVKIYIYIILYISSYIYHLIGYICICKDKDIYLISKVYLRIKISFGKVNRFTDQLVDLGGGGKNFDFFLVLMWLRRGYHRIRMMMM